MARITLLFAALIFCGCSTGDTSRVAPDAGVTPADGPAITFARLLEETTNLSELARRPDPPYTARQSSSYDRAAHAFGDGWFANVDNGKFYGDDVRDGRVEHVMMGATGPGVVTRIWSANPMGTLRVYVDGPEPVLEGDMAALLANPAPLGSVYAGGYSLYLPIPYQHWCRITVEAPGAKSLYYHVGYRTYSAETQVEPFTRQHVARPEIDRARARLASREAAPDGELQSAVLALPGGSASMHVDAPAGGGAVTELSIVPSRTDEDALRSTRLTIAFDGARTVSAPLGDFFGSGPGMRVFSTLPLSMREGGAFVSRFVMPFARTVDVRLERAERGDGEPLSATVSMRVRKEPWDARSLYFFARWRPSGPLKTRPLRDLSVVDAKGPGRLLGLTLNVHDGGDAWWGEGDEKIWIDEESFPSFFGTGTEDFFGYGWCSRELFAAPYHSQTLAPLQQTPACFGGHRGRTSLNRFFVIDSIPFARRARFDLELAAWDEDAIIHFDHVAYWYGAPETAPLSDETPLEDFRAQPHD